MKKLNILLFGLVLTFCMNVKVNASDVGNLTDFNSCLTGTEAVCKLTDDITTTSAITIPTGREVTIDLADKTLTLGGLITVEGKLTVTGNGSVKRSANYLFNVIAGGSLVLESGKYEAGTILGVTGTSTDSGVKTNVTVGKDASLSANYGVIILHAGSEASYGVTVNFDGTFKGVTGGSNGYVDGTFGISTNGYIKKTTGNVPVINISETANIESVEGIVPDTDANYINKNDAPAIYAAGYAIWNISGGTLKGSEALSIKSGEFNITGGTFNSFGEYNIPAEKYGNGSEATGAAISITANDGYAKNVELNISDATVTAEKGNALYEGLTNSTSTALNSISISGGTYTAGSDEDAKVIELGASAATGFITGGKYSVEPVASYIASPYVAKEEGTMYVIGVDATVALDEGVTSGLSKDDKEANNSILLDTLDANKNLVENVTGDIEIKIEISSDDINANDKALIEEEIDSDIEVATFLNIDVNVYANNQKVGELSELSESIKLTVMLPEELQEVAEGYTRTYYIIRVHEGENGKKVEKIDANVSEDGKYLTFESDEFSTYAVAYQDNIENPKTLDSITIYAILGAVSLIGLVVIIANKKRLFN